MFTGIVQEAGTLLKRVMDGEAGRLHIRVQAWEDAPELGESIAVEGVCLTLAGVEDRVLQFDVLGETFRCTNLGDKAEGGRVNIERALRHGQSLGGHIVNGHVDGVGRLRDVQPVGRDYMIEVTCDQDMMQGIVYKGSVACNGVSLTVAEVLDDGFRIHLIPFTWEVTSLSDLKPGGPVNLEIDVLGKYVRYFIEERKALPGITWEELRKLGLVEAFEAAD